MSTTGRPLPVIHPDNLEFWDFLARHELRLQQCGECGFLRYPVSPVCPSCLSDAAEWVALSGRGTLVAAVQVNRATGEGWWTSATPYSVALVRLEEGPRLKGFIANEAAASLEPGSPMLATFEDVEGATLLRFVAA